MLMKKILIMALFLLSALLLGCETEDNGNALMQDRMNEYIYNEELQSSFSEMRFITVSDVHYLSETLHDGGLVFQEMVGSSNGQMQYQAKEILDKFSKSVIEKKPDFVLVTGDLTLNGEKQSHNELSNIFKAIEEEGISVLVVPGNHDINNVYARSFFGEKQEKVDYVSKEEFERIYSDFGPNEAIYRDLETFSYVAKAGENVWILMIDSSSYEENEANGYPVSGGMLRKDQAEWLEMVFEEAEKQDKRIIIGMHHNMLKHAYVDDYYIKDFMISGALSGMPQYIASKGARVVFSGHIHCHDIAGERYDDDFMYDITTGSLMVYPHNYRVCSLDENGKLEIRTENIESLKGDNERGMSFYELSREQAYQKEGRDFFMPEGVSKRKAQKMRDFAILVANAYFEGEDHRILDDKENREAYALWEKLAEKNTDRRADMILGMSVDTEPRDRNIMIDLNTGFWENIKEE